MPRAAAASGDRPERVGGIAYRDQQCLGELAFGCRQGQRVYFVDQGGERVERARRIRLQGFAHGFPLRFIRRADPLDGARTVQRVAAGKRQPAHVVIGDGCFSVEPAARTLDHARIRHLGIASPQIGLRGQRLIAARAKGHVQRLNVRFHAVIPATRIGQFHQCRLKILAARVARQNVQQETQDGVVDGGKNAVAGARRFDRQRGMRPERIQDPAAGGKIGLQPGAPDAAADRRQITRQRPVDFRVMPRIVTGGEIGKAHRPPFQVSIDDRIYS